MHQIELKPRAIKDLKGIAKPEARKIVEKIMGLGQGLIGDIKRLTNFTPEYRMRVGDYRILFEVEEGTIVVYRIKHRNEAYRQR
ncbi:MAG: type II toxin-antitoxin system RelE/ParE family toxin [Nitrososphaera sp.]|nr:type II toxin-antitoxin system RelE/ParE family toxin [Nitrososphaera sp.]